MIKQQAKTGSRLLIALVALAVFATAFVIMEIRFGGPIERKHALNDEMLADILPPPAFVVEPYLEASLAAANPATGEAKLQRIRAIQSDFVARKVYWASAPVPSEMRAQLDTTIGVADHFFAAVDGRLAPAIASGERERINAVLTHDLTPIYERQRAEVNKLVVMSRAFDARETGRDNRMVSFCLAFSALVALIVVGAMQGASLLIRRHVLDPLHHTSQTIAALAAGNYDARIDGLLRTDEFGEMARAMDVFREAGLAREQAIREQEHVVEILTLGLDKLAAKDLEHRIDDALPESYDRLRRDYNTALDAFATAMGAVRVGAATVMNSISEIRAASDDLAERNEQQAANLQETAAAMQQVAERVDESAANTVNAQATIASARQQADEGGRVVQDAVQAMAAIEGSSQEIATIVDVIDGIAFQTNLLALNAGVEAARAGDAGKGFAVVATEVRALAQRSAEAAQNIKDLISKSSAQVEAGVSLVGQTGSKLDEIVGRIGELHDVVSSIADSARRQASDLRQVNNVVAGMDRMTQQNAAMVEQTTAATHSLEVEATGLTKMMSAFKTRRVMSRPDAIDNAEGMRRKSIGEEAPHRYELTSAAA